MGQKIPLPKMKLKPHAWNELMKPFWRSYLFCALWTAARSPELTAQSWHRLAFLLKPNYCYNQKPGLININILAKCCLSILNMFKLNKQTFFFVKQAVKSEIALSIDSPKWAPSEICNSRRTSVVCQKDNLQWEKVSNLLAFQYHSLLLPNFTLFWGNFPWRWLVTALWKARCLNMLPFCSKFFPKTGCNYHKNIIMILKNVFSLWRNKLAYNFLIYT